MGIVVAIVTYNVRAKRATTAGRQTQVGENVQRTTGPGLALRLSEVLGGTSTMAREPLSRWPLLRLLPGLIAALCMRLSIEGSLQVH